MIIETADEKETYRLAEQLAAEARPGTVITLDGDLGAGKTVFAKGYAAGLGIRTPVVSPTFTILHVYEEGRLPLYHFDVYRITDPDEMDEIGYEEYFYGQGVCLVEWSVQIGELVPADAVRITITRDPERGDDHRRIEIRP